MDETTADILFKFFEAGAEERLPELGGPANSQRSLESGNNAFVAWLERCLTIAEASRQPTAGESLSRLTSISKPGEVPRQAPHAVVLSCSDARVPVRLLLGQKVNNLFEIRVAGNVLADECLGSIEYALEYFESVKTVVVLGHTHCGAVAAAVDAFLNPSEFNEGRLPAGLRSIIQRLLGPVTQAARGLEPPVSADCAPTDSYQRLIDSAVILNAAMVSQELLQAVEQAGRSDVQVLYGVYDLASHYLVSSDHSSGKRVGLTEAPQNPTALERLAETVIQF